MSSSLRLDGNHDLPTAAINVRPSMYGIDNVSFDAHFADIGG